MSKRRLTLRRESLVSLQTDELASVVGAISVPHPLCVVLTVQHSRCETCGFGCTADCPPPA